MIAYTTEKTSTGAIPLREGIPGEHRWDLLPLYADSEAWEADFARLDDLAAPLEAMRGTLCGEEAVAQFCEADTRLDLLMDRLHTYAHLKADEDKGVEANQARESRVRAKFAEIAGRLAWASPEILANSEEDLLVWIASERLIGYRYFLEKLVRRKRHTLSEAEESLLAGAAAIFSGPGETYGLLTNVDLKFPEITDSGGESRELSQGRFLTFLESRDRKVRQDAFEGLYDSYQGVLNTVSCTLRTHVKTHTFLSRRRHYSSALEAALSPDNVPVALYEALIEANHRALPAFHGYMDLRRRQLGLDKLDMCDVYVPIVPEMDVKVPFEQACEWVVEACAPLGSEYVEALKTAFADRWIDRSENRGKRSGAYSSGCYESMPYILLNYQGRLDDVFTLAHELGHSMHSWLANHAQPSQLAGYPIFIAEIASTANEALLLDFLLKKRGDDSAFRAYLLNHYCDGFRGTVYRQTMFAEFEKDVHEMDAAGEALTPEALCDAYYELNRVFLGPAIEADRRISWEWARIPHFYYNFYVYKYATSFCASQIFAERILMDEPGRESYLGLLRAGGSADPLDLVRGAGVDLQSPEVMTQAFGRFEATVQELDDLLS